MRSLNPDARAVFKQAEHEARQMNHAFVGTEHVLLALVGCDFGPTSHTLQTFGLDATAVRREIEKLVQRGAEPVAAGSLPLTPRVQRAIESAIKEARLVSESLAGPEHLLLGLVGGLEGVAGIVLQNLGLDAQQLREEVLRPRLLQMKFVERAIRPLRAGTACKRKMREEMLAHLTAIYHEERTRTDDPVAAVEAAQKRFGDPAELAIELGGSLPRMERFRYIVERLFCWRVPETAAQFLLRVCLTIYALLAICCALVGAVLVSIVGFHSEVWIAAPAALALLTFLPAAQFVIEWLYFQLRDAIYGPPWAKKSLPRAIFYDASIAAATFAVTIAFVAVSTWSWSRGFEAWPIAAILAVAAAAGYFALAKHRGLTEISDTLWACLDLEPPQTA